jgi:hypothetical protein
MFVKNDKKFENHDIEKVKRKNRKGKFSICEKFPSVKFVKKISTAIQGEFCAKGRKRRSALQKRRKPLGNQEKWPP